MYKLGTDIINEIKAENISSQMTYELERIHNLLISENEIEAYPRITKEAPDIDFSSMSNLVKEKYFQLLNQAKVFK